jgi:hypothetical protein
VPNLIQNLQQKTDAFLTDYLRNTTTDQEILDFYGEGNIIGRKGIPETDRELIDQIDEAHRNLNFSPLRPISDRPNFSVGGIDQSIKYDYTTSDVPNLINPATGRPWQMTFGALPKDFGSASLTPAAQQFLVDFRVPKNTGSDYSFATGPNIQDRIDIETKNLLENDPYSGRQPVKLEEKLKEIKNQSGYIGDFSGSPQTPKTWQERGYIVEKPVNFKENVLTEFKNKIFETQGAFGGVSTLTPVQQQTANNPAWRAELYQKAGLAGPLSSESFNTGYGGGSKDVQRFTTGSERLLPLQPYNEFFKYSTDLIRSPSVVGKEPALDFTPFQKAVGTRNYLIGRNILEGRGNLGKGFAGGLSIGAADLIPSREIVADFYNKGPVQGLTRFAGDILGGIPAALIAGGAVTAAPVLAPIAAGTGLALTGNRALGAIDEIIKRQTGEGILSKVRQAIGTAPRTGVAAKPTPVNQPLTAEIRPLSSKEKTNMINRENRNEIQRRIDLAGERFNPRQGDFGLSELLFGR